MSENNRNQSQDQPLTGNREQGQQQQQGQPQPISTEKRTEENPQEGKEWSNYRTREMADKNEEGGADNISSKDSDL